MTTTNTKQVAGIAFTAYTITDIKRARTFYETVLGLKPASVWEGEDMAFIEYEIGTDTLAIGKGAPHLSPGKTGATVALEVSDFEAMVTTLRKHGVLFIMEPHETPVCHMALIADTEGNQIMIHKRKTQ
jgi:predicted enzyme related to lactoylglutathione lyase